MNIFISFVLIVADHGHMQKMHAILFASCYIFNCVRQIPLYTYNSKRPTMTQHVFLLKAIGRCTAILDSDNVAYLEWLKELVLLFTIKTTFAMIFLHNLMG